MRKLAVVGIGPGNYENMTIRADRALRECDVIVGYTVYVDLVKERYADKEFLTTPMLREVERCQSASFAGHTLLADTYLIQFLMELRGQLGDAPDTAASSVRSDPRFNRMLEFINQNLAGDLSVDRLAREFFLSSSYLMHAFKRHTGCTLHQYVLQKRLIQAAAAIREGEPVVASALAAGFSDYTTFLKAFRKQYGCAPGELR